MKKKKEYLAITVMGGEGTKKRVSIVRVRLKQGERPEEAQAYRDIAGAKVEIRMAKLMGMEKLWTRVETVESLKRDGAILIEGMTPIGRSVVMAQRPKALRAVWDIVGEENKIKQLEAENPHVKIYEMLVDVGDWDIVQQIVEESGMYVMEVGDDLWT